MDHPESEAQLEAGLEMKGLFIGPISPDLFLEAFLTEGTDCDTAIEKIKERILAARGAEKTEGAETRTAKKRKEVSGEDRVLKRPRLEGSRESTSPLTTKETFPELVGDTPFLR